ncbi:hypothetical protein BDZ89DRAFT_826188 [Hymenopellis radicata]|nr:hypothetical protein BDZ89DRAFT_826188 [Hymenopellis radicata]
MLFGMAFIRAMNRVGAERSEYYRRDVRLEDCDVHAAALLDILAGLWQKECTMRNRCIATRDDQVLPDHSTAGLPRRSMVNFLLLDLFLYSSFSRPTSSRQRMGKQLWL